MININNFDKYLNEFVNTTNVIPYLDNGIFDSELFLIYSLYNELNCKLIIESGICYGYSTRILLSSLKTKHYGVELSNEFICYGKSLEKEYSNFTFYNGNSFDIIPKILEENKNQKVFINIDGPKNDDAVKLKNILLKYKNVGAVSIHDYEDKNTDFIFSTKNNTEFNKKYFDILNEKQKNKKHSVYTNNSYAEIYPTGPGLTVYVK